MSPSKLLRRQSFPPWVRFPTFVLTYSLKFYPSAVVPWTSPNGKIMRRGQTGGSSEMLTLTQQRRIDEHCRNELLQMGCDFPYYEAFSQKN